MVNYVGMFFSIWLCLSCQRMRLRRHGSESRSDREVFWKQIFKLILAKNFGPLFLQDLVVKSVVSGLEEMRVDWQKSGCNSRYNSYKLLGETKNRDNLRPWHQVTTSCLTATWGRTFSRWTAGLRSTQSRWTWRWTHLLWESSSLLLAFTSPPVGWVKAL